MDGGGAEGSGACAACKHQRRKCGPDCPMARYFPPSRAQEFRDVHRLFGVSNLTRIHNNLPPGENRDMAMRTMVIEAGLWRADPVRGAYGLIRDLQAQIAAAEAELGGVRRQLASRRRGEKPRMPSVQVPGQPPLPPPVVQYPYNNVVQIRPQIGTVPSVVALNSVLPDDPGPSSESSSLDDYLDTKDHVRKDFANPSSSVRAEGPLNPKLEK